MTWAAFERRAYQAARSWGMQPSEFWALPVCDWWAEFDAKIVEARRIEEMSAGQTGGIGGHTQAEWAEAKRRHKERMRDRARCA